jgi:uncharacterized protein YciU (UPF0263 family)
MKKFNLFKEIVIANKTELLQAINKTQTFGIKIDGKIVYEPFDENDIFIFIGKHIPQSTNALMAPAKPSLEKILGKNYQIVEDGERILIKAFSNWQEIIGFNIERASYDDTTGDGVSEFSNNELEDIGWNATEFNITYRELVEILEEKCEGTLICIEQEEPFQFSGLGFLSDNPHAKEVLFSYCQKQIKKLMDEDDLYKKENLTDDELEAAEFFKAI